MEKQHPYMLYMSLYGYILVFYYAHYAINFDEYRTKNLIFLVNNKVNFATTFTTPGSWKITYFYFIAITTTFTTAWFWQKKIIFDFDHFYFCSYYIHVFYYVQHDMIKIILFSFLYYVIRHDQKKTNESGYYVHHATTLE